MELRSLALLTVSLIVAGGTARASVLYSFTVNGTTVQPFSFSLTTPNFLNAGNSGDLTPFTITAGANTLIINQNLAGSQAGLGCFTFAAADGTALNCGTSAPVTSAAFELDVLGGLPTATGPYSVSGIALLLGNFEALTGTLSITSTIASIPEPSSFALIGSALMVVSWKLRRRP